MKNELLNLAMRWRLKAAGLREKFGETGMIVALAIETDAEEIEELAERIGTIAETKEPKIEIL